MQEILIATKVEMIHLPGHHEEAILLHQKGKVETEVIKNAEEGEVAPILLGQDRDRVAETEVAVRIVSQAAVDEVSRKILLVETVAQLKEEIETPIQNLVQTTMIEGKAALKDQSVLDRDLLQKNIKRKGDKFRAVLVKLKTQYLFGYMLHIQMKVK